MFEIKIIQKIIKNQDAKKLYRCKCETMFFNNDENRQNINAF